MFERFISGKFSSRCLLIVLATVSILSTGCSMVGRTRVDIERVEYLGDIGGPYYVVDTTDLIHASRKISHNEALHEACECRYPMLFSKSRAATPLLVSRNAKTTKSNSGFAFSYFLPASSLGILPPFPQTAVIEDRIDVAVGNRSMVSKSFVSRETEFLHVLTTYPLNSVLFPKSKGWGPATNDQSDPMRKVNDVRFAAYADAIVHSLASMSETERAALPNNQEAWSRYYEIRPYVFGKDAVPQQGKIVHEIQVERPSANARIPVVKSFTFDVGRLAGTISGDLSGCDALFAQKWIIHKVLPEKLAAAFEIPGSRAIFIQKESLSREGLYSLAFSVVE